MIQLKFEDSFWGTDFNSTAGYDVLFKRMKEGKTTCNLFENYLKQRAKIEEDYGKALFRICKSSADFSESGTVADCWDLLRSETEKIANIHLELATSLSDMEIRISEFTKKQRIDRKNIEESVINLSKEKINLYKKTALAKKTYHERGIEFENANNHLNKARVNQQSIPTKEWDQVVKNGQKSKNELEKAELSYKELISKLDELRLIWESQMKNYCNLCEVNEKSRLIFLHNELWVLTNLISCGCLEIDAICEAIRKMLEQVSIVSDLNSFVKKNTTGNLRPEAVLFEDYKKIIGSRC